MAVELENAQDAGVGGRIGKSMSKGAASLLYKGATIRESDTVLSVPANVTVCGSGNLAQVYFDLYNRKITLTEFNTTYPGLVDALVTHEGIGFVVAYEEDLSPIILGKSGQRNLHTGLVMGEDPLKAFGDCEFRASQVRRIADFPHSGDLIVMSTIYPDGSVAAMEELIGSHGGLGGEQTDAFIFHAMDMEVPETCNSTDVFSILNKRRGLAGAPATPERPIDTLKDAWSINTLLIGIRNIKGWFPQAVGTLLLQRDVYRKIAIEDGLTGPAILLALMGTIVLSTTLSNEINWLLTGLQIGVWFITVLMMYLATRLLRGKTSYTAVLRVMGFAQGIYILDILSLIPGIGPMIRFVVSLLAFLATWIGVAIASELKGFRTIILPVVYLLVFVVGFVVIYSVSGGLSVTLDALQMDFGLR
jgi:hypothetical protein